MPDVLITSIAISPATGPVGIGQTVVFTLDADGAVSVDTANGQPSLRLSNGGVAAYDAAASAAAGADKLVFRYTVAAGDAGSGGLGVAALDLNGAVVSGPAAGPLFASAGAFFVGDHPIHVAVADVTADGTPDVVATYYGAGYSNGGVSLLEGDGSGGFLARRIVAPSENQQAALGADVNGDGKADVVATNYDDGDVSVLRSDGAGGFLPDQRFPAGADPVRHAVADVDGDGAPDIVVPNQNADTVSVLLNTGAGGFAAPATFAVGDEPMEVAVADVDGDGDLDIAAVNLGSDDVTVLRGDGLGGFTTLHAALPVGSYPNALAVADATGDGKADIVVANNGSGTVSVLTGNGLGGFAARQDVATVDSSFVAVADATGDGVADIVALDSINAAVVVLPGDGQGWFGAPQSFSVGAVGVTFPAFAAVADATGDGVLDIVSVDDTSGTATLLKGRGGPSGFDASSAATAPGHDAGPAIDAQAPSVVSADRAGGAPALTNGSSASFTVAFSEAVTGVDASDFALATTGTAAGAVSAVSGGGSTRTVTVSGLSGDGTLRLDLAPSGTGIADAAGNPIAGGFASGQAYTLDRTAPSVVSVSAPADGTYEPGEALDFSVSFDQAVAVGTGGGTPYLELDVGGTVRRAEYVSGSGTSSLLFRHVAQAGDGDGDGVAVAALRPNGGTLRDAAGNDAATALNAVAPTTGVLVDGVVPGVAVTADDTTLVAGQTATVTISFTEAITGFDSGDVTVSGGSLGALATADGGATWTGAFTPDSSDALAASIAVAAGAAQNAAGEANTASNTLVLTGDTARPAVAVGLSDTALRAGEAATVTFSFTEAPTGFALADATAAAGTLGALAATADPKVFTATLTPPAGVETTGAAVTVGTGWTDAAGNAPAAAANSAGYDVDTARPAVAAIERQAPPGGTVNADSLVFRVAFDGPVVGVDAGDFTVAGTSATVTGVAPAGAGAYDVTVSGGDLAGLDGTVALGFAGGQDIADPAGNALGTTAPAGTNDNSYVLDNTAPSVASVSVPPGGTYGQGGTLDFAVSFGEAVAVGTGGGTPHLELDVGGATRQAAYVSGSGTPSLLFRYAVQAGDLDTNGIAVAALRPSGATLRDAAGNDADPALNGVAATAGVLVDGVRPAAASIVRAGGAPALTNGSSASFTVAFGEAVTGVDASDFALATTGTAAGAVSAVAGAGSTRTVTVSGLAGDGELRLDLAASGTGIADAAGNAIIGGYGGGEAYVLDHTAPGAPGFDSMAGDTGALGDLVTAAAAPELRFLAPGADGVSVHRTAGGQTAYLGEASRGDGDGWTFAFAGAPEGAHAIVAEARDAAGNASAPSDPVAILVDRHGPVANPDIGIRISEGATDRPLVELRGAVSDGNTAPGAVVLTLTAAPAHGTLELGGVPLAAGDRFTLADVWAGLLTYTHDGGGPAVDGFGFEAGDGASVDPHGRLAIEVRRAPPGGGAGDVVYGGDNDDVIHTPDGGATIVASGGDDTVFGGAGLDAVRYGGLRNGHAITDGSGLPERVAGPLGTAVVSGVETLEFLDGRVEYAPSGAGHLVERLYAGIFGRPADAEGMSFWAGKLEEGWGTDRVAQGMAGAREHAGLPPTGQDAYLRGLYRDVLHRDADPVGLASWTRALEEGAMTRAGVAAAMAGSAEAVSLGTAHPVVVTDHGMLVAARAYQVVLGRAPDLDGLRFWDGRIDAEGLSAGDVGRAFAATGEFQARYGGVADAAFVDALYGQAFGRSGEDAGRSGWLDALAAGASRQEVAVAFLLAEEGLPHRAQLAADGLSLIG